MAIILLELRDPNKSAVYGDAGVCSWIFLHSNSQTINRRFCRHGYCIAASPRVSLFTAKIVCDM